MKQTQVLEWAPSTGNATPGGTAIGWSLTSSGTVSHPGLASGTLQSQMRRTRYTSATTANAVAGLRSADKLCWRGLGAGFGGFTFTSRFSMSTNVASSRAFIGLSAASGTVVSAEPSAAADSIGVGFDSTDSSGGNWQLLRKDGATSVKADLGTSAARNTTDVFDLTITAVANSPAMTVRLVNLSTGVVVHDNVVYTTNLPTNNVFLYAHAEIGPASAGVATQLELASMCVLEHRGSSADLSAAAAATFPTIASLQSATDDFAQYDCAKTIGYFNAGDQGGGEYYFEGSLPSGAAISAIAPSSSAISTTTRAVPIAVTTSLAHGLVTGQAVHIAGVQGNTNANGDWIVDVTNSTSFTLRESIGGPAAPINGTGNVSTALVTTQGPHSLETYARAMIAGVRGSIAPDINKTWPLVGVVGSSQFSVALPTTAHTYSGGGALGDGGASIPSASLQGRWLLSSKGPLNVRQFGAVGDGTTDDQPAFQAAIEAAGTTSNLHGTVVQIPQGTYWMANNLHIDRNVILSGLSSTLTQYARLLFPPSKGVIIEYPGSYPRGRGDFSILENLWISSTLIAEFLLPPGLAAWVASHAYILGDRVLVGGTDNSFWAECTRAGTSGASNPFGSGPYVLGQNFDEGAGKPAWVIRRISAWANAVAFNPGDRIQVPGENRFHYLCVRAGTTASSPAPSPFVNATTDSGDSLGTTIDEGIGKPAWLVVAHTGVRMRARAKLRNVQIELFTNCGVSMLPEFGFSPQFISNDWRLEDVYISQCGVGVFTSGADSSAGVASGVTVTSAGAFQAGAGGHAFFDHSVGGNTWLGCEVELSTGRNYNINGTGNSVLVGCYSEGGSGQPDRIIAPAVVFGGQNGFFSADSTGVRIGANGGGGNPNTGCRHIGITDGNGDPVTNVLLSQHDGQAVLGIGVGGPDDASGAGSGSGDFGNTIAYRYQSAGAALGWWVHSFGNQNEVRPMALSAAPAPEGPGHWWDCKGHFQGGDYGTTNRYFVGYDPASPFMRQVRGGGLSTGDRFELQYGGAPRTHLGQLVQTSGFRGRPWFTGWSPEVRNRRIGVFSDMVQPTTANGRVYRCTQSGTVGSSEPNWGTTTTGPEVYSWTPNTIVRLNDLIRANPKPGGSHYYKAETISVNPGFHDVTTGSSQPAFSGTTVVETTPSGTVTWKDQGTEQLSGFVQDGTVIWTDVGPAAQYLGYDEAIDPRKLSLAISTGTNTLSATEYSHRFIELTGILTGNVTIQFPSSSTLQFAGSPICTDWLIRNTTTGGFTVTLKTVGQAGGLVLASGNSQAVWSDGSTLRAMAPAVAA